MPAVSVFPMNPIAASVRKGEIKDRYFNPCDLFDQVQVVSPEDEDLDPATVQCTVGRASLDLAPAGWHSRQPALYRVPAFRRFLREEVDRLADLVGRFAPDVIRSFSTQIPGWLAVNVAARLGVPSVVSVHGDYDRDVREYSLRHRKWRQFAVNFLLGKLVERETLSGASRVICAYRFPVAYARRYGAKQVEVIYNRVDLRRFAPAPRPEDRPFTML